MPIERHTMITLAATVVGMGIGFASLSWPRYRHASSVQSQIETVKQRVSNEAEELAELERVVHELKRLQDHVGDDLRRIPGGTDMASLITALTVHIDGATVLDQTFNRGRTRPVATVSDGSLYAMPLTVEMACTFDRVFEMIEVIESMRDLVRVSMIRVERHPKFEEFVQATITIDAIFEVAVETEEGRTSKAGVPIRQDGDVEQRDRERSTSTVRPFDLSTTEPTMIGNGKGV